MLKNSVIWLIWFFIPLAVQAQEQTDSQVCKNFVEIYLGEKQYSSESLGNIDSVLFQTGLHPNDYAEYLHGKRTSEQLPDSLQQIEATWITLQNQFAVEKQAFLLVLCAQNDMELDTYLAMRSKYLSEIAFNRKMLPYFEAYFEKQKDE